MLKHAPQLRSSPRSPHPCCVPSKERLAILSESTLVSAARPRATAGSAEGMLRLDGGDFLMGSEAPEAIPGDGEGPVKRVALSPFWISAAAATVAQFREFAAATGYVTDAERFGWSFVFRNHVPPEQRGPAAPATPWWVRVNRADFRRPKVPPTIPPATTIQWSRFPGTTRRPTAPGPASACPTEAEWEYAARGGLEQKNYPWAMILLPTASIAAIFGRAISPESIWLWTDIPAPRPSARSRRMRSVYTI